MTDCTEIFFKTSYDIDVVYDDQFHIGDQSANELHGCFTYRTKPRKIIYQGEIIQRKHATFIYLNSFKRRNDNKWDIVYLIENIIHETIHHLFHHINAELNIKPGLEKVVRQLSQPQSILSILK